jgi:threonine/homoserine/homoserine lactone efflux protein
VTVNLLNPNPYLSWSLVMGPLVLRGWRENPANGIALAAVFYFMMIFISGGVIILFAVMRKLGTRGCRDMVSPRERSSGLTQGSK